MFCGNEIKIAKKIILLIKNRIYGFLLQITYNYILLPPNNVPKNEFLFPRSSPFLQSQVTSSLFKTNRNSKFKPTMFHE